MKKEIAISAFGKNLIFEKGYTKEFILSTIKEMNLNGIEINTRWQNLENLDFLTEFTFLKSLVIVGNNDMDFNILRNLPNLVTLSISLTGKNKIDLSNQKNLENLAIYWRKGKIIGLENCQKIKSICLVTFNEENLKAIEKLKNLSELKIKTSSIKSAKGLENLPLENIEFGNCRSLESINSINNNIYLKGLSITSCSKIKDYDSLDNLTNLENLDLINNKEIPSIKFVKNFKSLIRLSLLENTIVGDGDLLPAKDIKEVYYKHLKHYNYKIENEEIENKMKRNLEKLKVFFKVLK